MSADSTVVKVPEYTNLLKQNSAPKDSCSLLNRVKLNRPIQKNAWDLGGLDLNAAYGRDQSEE